MHRSCLKYLEDAYRRQSDRAGEVSEDSCSNAPWSQIVCSLISFQTTTESESERAFFRARARERMNTVSFSLVFNQVETDSKDLETGHVRAHAASVGFGCSITFTDITIMIIAPSTLMARLRNRDFIRPTNTTKQSFWTKLRMLPPNLPRGPTSGSQTRPAVHGESSLSKQPTLEYSRKAGRVVLLSPPVSSSGSWGELAIQGMAVL